MANYFTKFSCVLDVKSPENAARALTLFEEFKADSPDDEQPANFTVSTLSSEGNPDAIWMRSGADDDIEGLIAYVKRCAEEFNLTGYWGFEYANTCAQPRLDAFGGGAHILNLTTCETVSYVESREWLDLTMIDLKAAAEVEAGSPSP